MIINLNNEFDGVIKSTIFRYLGIFYGTNISHLQIKIQININ